MTAAGAITAWSALFLILYVYAGYPIVLWVVTRFYRRGVRKGDVTPRVTLLISAFNEEEALGAKLENTLALDYPRELLEILVISDHSTDATDSIVLSFADRGVNLLRMPERGGKTVGLNAAVRRATGEILLFSDANILYRTDVVRRLVANFADPRVGCVTGDTRFGDQVDNAAHDQENAYWGYERFIRTMESDLSSTVGGDGAMFAIHKHLYRPLAPDMINDFVIPLQIVARGLRAVFEPGAVGIEPSAGSFDKEFRRKQRIVNRSWRGVMSTSDVLNPFRVGVFAWQVWSHKVLRWLVPWFVAAGVLGCAVAWPGGAVYRYGLYGFGLTILMAALGSRAATSGGLPAKLCQAAYYFYLVNIASALGVMRAMSGRVDTIWSPERGAAPQPESGRGHHS